METQKTIRISFVILVIAATIALIIGIVAAFMPGILISRSFPLYTGQPWNDLLTSNSLVSNYILIKERMMGIAWIAGSLCGLFVLFSVFRKAEKWAWYCMLVLLTVLLGSAFVEGIIFNNPPVIGIAAISLLLAFTGLIISVGVFVKNK